jgi:maltooligosyltrehalose trehalohydrolase
MEYRFGPHVGADSTQFHLWAPGVRHAKVHFRDREPVAMRRADDGFLVAEVRGCPMGTRYKFDVDGLLVPDPASRQQDGDTRGWSVVTAPLPPSGRGPLRPWQQTISCEVHVGTVSPEGSFTGLMDRLEHFRDAGFTNLELMPVNTFPGRRNWGYDGTLIFAPDQAYGTREELRALVDRAHDVGLCMVLDVVYNHFGEVDNFLADYAPEWFAESVATPWGPGIDFTEPMVRQFYYENAVMWLSEFDFDGLRFDAVHEMKTEARDLFLGELAEVCRAIKPWAKLITENTRNVASWLRRDERNEPIAYTAQWNEDIHHVLNQLVTGEGKGGYDDKTRDPVADLEKGLAHGFIHDGEAAGFSDGRTRGEAGSELPPDAFVSYVQNHDQIGNRPDGQRLPARISARKLDFVHFVTLLAPQIPLLFMGEEANLDTPFYFFVDLDAHHAAAKRADRYEQMKTVFNECVREGDLPDPNDEATFLASRLDWAQYETGQGQASLGRFRELVTWRRDKVWPLAVSPCRDATTARHGNCLIVNWVFETGTLSMALNPTDQPADLPCLICDHPVATGEFSQHGDVLRLGAWSAVVWSRMNRQE